MKAKCKAHFRRGEAACANCTSADPRRFETDAARADSADEDKVCARGLKVADRGPCDCESCDQPDCEDRCAVCLDDDNVDADGHGDSDYVEDGYGNEGLRLFDVTVVFERSQTAKKTYRIAADDEDDAKERVYAETGDEDYEELDWEDQGDGTTDYVDEVVEVED